MPPTTYVTAVRDTSVVPPGLRKTGLSPTWVFLKRLSDNGDILPLPAITEVAQGQYKWTYDPELHGDATGQIDAGATLPNPSDRYLDVLMTRENGRILAALGPAGAQLDFGQSLPAANAAQTVGDALNAARALGFGRTELDPAATPPTLTLYAADNVTVVHTFVLDDADNPTSRN